MAGSHQGKELGSWTLKTHTKTYPKVRTQNYIHEHSRLNPESPRRLPQSLEPTFASNRFDSVRSCHSSSAFCHRPLLATALTAAPKATEVTAGSEAKSCDAPTRGGSCPGEDWEATAASRNELWEFVRGTTGKRQVLPEFVR